MSPKDEAIASLADKIARVRKLASDLESISLLLEESINTKMQMRVTMDIAVDLDVTEAEVSHAVSEQLRLDRWVGEDWVLLTIRTQVIGELDENSL